MKNSIRRTSFFLLLSWILFFFGWVPVSATPNNLHIIPENLKDGSAGEWKEQAKEDVNYVWNATSWGTAIERYTEKAKEIEKEENIGRAFQTWIMGRNTLIQYVVYLMKFLSQLGLLIWGIMILYAGYLYATTIFGMGDPSKAKSAIKNAIIWVIVVVASYAILRGLTSLFL